jgi:hypothetical protein
LKEIDTPRRQMPAQGIAIAVLETNLKEVNVLFLMATVFGIGVGAAFVTVRRRRKAEGKTA